MSSSMNANGTNGHRYVTWAQVAIVVTVAIAVASGYGYHVDARLDRQEQRIDKIGEVVLDLVKGDPSGGTENFGR